MAKLKFLFVGALLLNTVGCSSSTNNERSLLKRSPSLVAESLFIDTLNRFGKPDKSYTISIQNFEDLSGSRSEGGISTSVVSSGKFLTEFLLTSPALRKKFYIFNRSQLNALLTERKLANAFDQDRKQRLIEKSNPLLKDILKDSLKPKYDFIALEPSQYLIIGAVIGYDKSIDEYGQGLGIMGANAKEKTSIDQLHVMVQLIDTNTGRIISVGSGTEEVKSKLRTQGYFGLINPYRILELENGGVKNDPSTIAFFMALQVALMEMFENV
ncbi:MAG: hypothetical protein KC484_14075 [Colwelliaceae bacterium]|jgi:curli biogenesis system outer membrane secretion channel CsgG|nr:hypothetical protein [Colwelliaceae bacterium]